MKQEMTSDSHPIRVDFVRCEQFNLPGKIGLTFAPGKKQPAGQSGSWKRDLDMDLRRLREFYGTDVLVSLIEEHEFETLQIKNLRERAADFNISSIWFPIRDQNIPESLEETAELIKKINEFIAAGQTVVIHCMGGLGRTGLIAAGCLLAAEFGLTTEEAIRIVRAVRSGAVENQRQEKFIEQIRNYLQNNHDKVF